MGSGDGKIDYSLWLDHTALAAASRAHTDDGRVVT
jgi:hypothetical protein